MRYPSTLSHCPGSAECASSALRIAWQARGNSRTPGQHLAPHSNRQKLTHQSSDRGRKRDFACRKALERESGHCYLLVSAYARSAGPHLAIRSII
eukprot:3941930-Rhodomonas_salina.3